MKTKVHHHASVVIVYSGNELLVNIYDDTYPRVKWRNSINILGGGQDKEDTSPLQLLRRELNEEFMIKSDNMEESYDSNFSDVVGEGQGAPAISKFASAEDIELVKKTILENMKPFRDYLTGFPADNNKPAFNVIFSTYYSEVSPEVMTLAKKNLSQGKSLVSEGFLRVTSLEELKSGKITTAWAAGHILENFFKIDIPNKNEMDIKDLGLPRDNMQEYFDEFDYTVK